jgi:hypothetical protein
MTFLPHNSSLPELSKSDDALAVAKSYLQSCYSKVLGSSSKGCQVNYDPCIEHAATIKLWKSRHLEAVTERDRLQDLVNYLKRKQTDYKTQVKAKLKDIAVHYTQLADDLEESRASYLETSQAFRSLVEERDNLWKLKQILSGQVKDLDQENVRVRQQLLKGRLIESQLSKTAQLQDRYGSPVKTRVSPERRQLTQEEKMPFLATAGTRWSQMLRVGKSESELCMSER